eukprot:7376267-Prymnesium_polylepis.1
MAKIMKANPALYVLRERIRKGLQARARPRLPGGPIARLLGCLIALFVRADRAIPLVAKLRRALLEPDHLVCRRHQRLPRHHPQDFRGQPHDQAHQRRHLHLQPAHRPALPQDHPHVGVGGPEAPRPARQVEDGRGGGGAHPLAARRGAAQADHRHAQGHARPTRGARHSAARRRHIAATSPPVPRAIAAVPPIATAPRAVATSPPVPRAIAAVPPIAT